MEINEIIKDSKVIDYTHEGLGIVKHEGQVIFVEQALKDEVVNIQITQQKKKIYYAKILDIIVESTQREKPICPHYKQCGGCNLQHMSYEEQINVKSTTFKNSLDKNNLKLNVENIKQSNKKIEYRNKVTFSFVKENEDLYLGMKKKKSNEVVRIDYCFLISKSMNEVKDEILIQLRKLNLQSKDVKGPILDQLIIKENLKNEFLIHLKTNLKNTSYIIDNLEISNKVIAFYIEDIKGKMKHIKNELFIQRVRGLSYIVSPKAFFQINNEQTENIYEDALNLMEKNDAILLDAYCGSGTIGQFLNSKVNKVIGIEINKDSIKDALNNARLNNINNCQYICGDIQKVIENIYEENENYFDTVIIDPPRKGVAKNFIQILNKHKPKEIIYISCQPSTLIRDLKLLKENYKVTYIKQYDMFAQTYHIETLVRLERDERNR